MPDFLGSSVVVPGSQRATGVLKYVGSIRGKTGMFGGIELSGPSASDRGKNSGEVDGVQYFDVSEPMTGLFMPWDRLRAANPSLPAADRLKSRPSSSKRASVCTPTPPRRSSPSPRVFNGHSSLSESSRSFSRVNSFSRDSRRSPSMSKLVLDSPMGDRPASSSRAVQTSGVSAEAAELRAKLDAKSRESDRKEAILLELQATVDQLHPVLEDYERNLEEKDRKLKKQKNDYDRAREEWRSSLDLMLSSQQEAENLYEMQISDLKEEIQALASASRHSSGKIETESVAELTALRAENDHLRSKLTDVERQIELLHKENTELRIQYEKSVAPTSTSGAGQDGDNELVESLKKKVDMLTQDVTSMEIVLQDAQAKSRAKSAEVAELEIKLEELTSQEVEILSDKVVDMSLGDWEKDVAQYQEKIAALEQSLEAAYTKSIEGSDSARANELELAKLRDTAVKNAAEMHALQQKIESLEAEKAKNSECVSPPATKDEEYMEKIATLKEQQSASEETIKKLTHDLDNRPSYEESELTELQNSLEMVESLHKQEMADLQEEFKQSQAKNSQIEIELHALQEKLASFESKAAGPETDESNAKPYTSESTDALSLQASNGSLPIYKPAIELDPSQGRDDWCGLCERDGHDSLNCPYENDMF